MAALLRLWREPEGPVLLILGVLAAGNFVFIDQAPFTVGLVRSLLSQASILALISAGFCIVLLAGHLDLSVGSVSALGGITVISLQDSGLITSFIIALLVCAAVGLINGLLVTVVGIPSLVATLATLLGARGLAFVLSEGQPVQGDSIELALTIERAVLGLFSIKIIAVLLIILALDQFMRRSVWGRHILALGGKPDAAKAAGLPVRSRTVQVFVVSSILAGIGGAIQALALNSASPTAGETALLLAIAAVVVGGTSLQGGRGTVLGSYFGVLLLTSVVVLLGRAGIDSAYQRVLIGSLLLGSVFASWSSARGASRTPKESSDRLSQNGGGGG